MSNLDQAVRFAIQEIAVGPDRGRNIDAQIAEQVMQGILAGEVDDVQAAVILIALRMKRESTDEMRGLTRAAQSLVRVQTADVESLVTLADPFDGYSRTVTLSAFIPCVLAAMDVPTVMHGCNSVGPKFGVTAQQVLSKAGVYDVESPLRAARDVEGRGWAYTDQRHYAPELYSLIALRNKIIKRTALTTLERVLMPVKARKQNQLALGYVHKAYPEIYASIAAEVGFDAIHLSKGIEGGLMVAMNKPFARYSACLAKKNFSLTHESFDHFEGRQAVPTFKSSEGNDMSTREQQVEQCLDVGLSVLRGAKSPSRDALVVATANILSAVKPQIGFTDAVVKASSCIDNGSALERFMAST